MDNANNKKTNLLEISSGEKGGGERGGKGEGRRSILLALEKETNT